MKTTIGEITTRQHGTSMAFVKPQYRKGYEIPLLPHQKFGILSKVLWPSKNQVLRIVPGYDEATGTVFHQNANCNKFSQDGSYDDYLTDTFCKATIVGKFGSVVTPFITDYEPGSADEKAWGGNTVLRSFIRGIIYACGGRGRSRIQPLNEWRTWTGIGPGSVIEHDRPALLMQALVFQVNGRNNQNIDTNTDLVDEDGDILPMLAVVAINNRTSISNLVQALVEPMNPALPLDAASNNKYGPMAELDGNKLYLNTYQDPQQHNALRPSVQAPGQGWTPDPFPLDENAVKQLWIPWEKLLSYMTAKEQLELCAREFGADTVNYVIGTDPNFNRLEIPEEIKSAGLGRYASLVGGGSITLSSNSYSPSNVGARPTGSGFGKGLAGAQAKAPSFSIKPEQQVKTFGISRDAGVDIEAVKAKARAIRAAAAQAEDDQAISAQELLGE